MQTQNTPKPRYFTLTHDRLSVGGDHPRSGDLCAAVEGEGAEGELHIVQTDAGAVYLGRLYHKGGSVIIRCPNGAPTTLLDSRVLTVRRVTQFFYAQDVLAARQPRRTKPRTSERVVSLTDWRATHHLNA